MIIDFHVHAFPDALAAKALPLLSKCSGGVKPNYDATISGLESYLAKNNVDYAVVLNIATNPHQEKKVNDFAISLLEKKNIIPFGSVHPDSPNALSELERLAKAGIRGIKLHPDYQHFFVDDEKMFPIYKKIAELGFITVFHAGVDIGYPKPVHCTPERLLRVLDLFDDAPVVAAHFGGWLLWDSVLEDLCGTKVYLDTAFSSGKMPPDYAKELIKAHGADKVLLGSDMPWSDTLDEVRFVQSLDLSAEDEEKILSNNAKRLLNI
ncbi:MAG TPA: amidohydrolase family protein [Candidatus Fimenecus excrementavium]|nr:amidohydrolase family protein [Candidatus Fimenecus excrementavium]